MHRRTTAAVLLFLATPCLAPSPASAAVTRAFLQGRQLGATVSTDATLSCVANGVTVTQPVFISVQRWQSRGNAGGSYDAPWVGLTLFTDGPCGMRDISSQTYDLDPATVADSSTVEPSLRGATIAATFRAYDQWNLCTTLATISVTLTAATKVSSATADSIVAHAPGYHEAIHFEGRYTQANATGSLVLSDGCGLSAPLRFPITAAGETESATIQNSMFGYTIITKD